MTIKTWNQRMPVRLPENVNASVNIALDCMMTEISELRIELKKCREYGEQVLQSSVMWHDHATKRTAQIVELRAELEKIKAQRDALAIEVAALKLDAARYRWLRDSMESPIVSEGQATDKMVDAAMKEGVK